jgi:large subunit ribosomal protein L35
MMRNQVLKSSRRLLATSAESATKTAQGSKSWASDGKASPSLKAGDRFRSALLDGVSEAGPPSLKTEYYRKRYIAPSGLNEAFDAAYEILKSKSASKYNDLKEVEEKLSQSPQEQELIDLKNKIQIEAEINNPEVRFNFDYNEKIDNDPRYIDYEQPVYRELKKKHWESYGQMLLMQRLESLAIIPDSLPTLDPKVEVSLKFLNHTGVNKWIEPGTLLSSNATTYAPSIKIQEYENVDTSKQQYSVLIVNLDVPDVENNTYKTQINWGLSNIKLNYNDNFINPAKLLNDTAINEIIDYLPPTPEKNLPKQRFALWVFRQSKELNLKLQERDFDIREFVSENQLEPVGAHTWRSAWDLNVSKVRELYGLPKGQVFHKVKGRNYM